MQPHFGFSFVTPARELLWKLSSGPRSEKVARLCSPFCSGTPIFCRTQTLVLYSVQLIRSTRLQHHNSNAVIRFSSHFFTAQLSNPHSAMLHINELTNCFFSFRLISADFHIYVSCLMTCRANRTFIL